MASAELQVSTRAGVARVVVSNPERRNALNARLQRELAQAWQRLDADRDVRCIVLSGAGTEAFISGADISEFEQLRQDAAAEAEYLRHGVAAMVGPAMTATPVVAAIRGACVGGGLQLAVACDVRIATHDAFFMMPAARLGLGYPYAGLAQFVSLLGRGRTADLFMSARRLPAAEALEMGLVDRLVGAAEYDDAVSAYAAQVAQNAPLTHKLVKVSLRWLAGVQTLDEPAAIQALQDECAASADLAEGRRAFMEKRKPVFKGV